jgi:penicillin-binding protein 1A
MTIAVWVGYPDKLTPMETEFGGEPVAGGTFPAQIWRDFATQAKAIFKKRIDEREARRKGKEAPEGEDPAELLDAPVTGGSESDDNGDGGGDEGSGEAKSKSRGDGGSREAGGDGGSGGGGEPTPAPSPVPEAQPAPAPAPTPEPAAPEGGVEAGGVTPP